MVLGVSALLSGPKTDAGSTPLTIWVGSSTSGRCGCALGGVPASDFCAPGSTGRMSGELALPCMIACGLPPKLAITPALGTPSATSGKSSKEVMVTGQFGR